MKKILYTLPLILIVLAFTLTHSGCSKSDDVVTPPVDENVDKETTVSKDMVELSNLMAKANSYVWQYVNNGGSTGCPNIYYDAGFYGALVIDYGSFPGCVASDNIKRSGLYALSYYVNPAADSIYTTVSFTDFRVYKYADITDINEIKITGFFSVSSKKISGTTYSFHTSGEGGFTTNSGVSKTVTLTGYNGTANLNSATTADDDVYTMYGSSKIVDSGVGSTFDITINPGTALQVATNCRYPLTGIAYFTSGSSITSCDFSPASGTCDAIVKLTKGSTVKTIDLTNTDF